MQSDVNPQRRGLGAGRLRRPQQLFCPVEGQLLETPWFRFVRSWQSRPTSTQSIVQVDQRIKLEQVS